jgi:hypothetical protein
MVGIARKRAPARRRAKGGLVARDREAAVAGIE